ncbi:MAG: hypothetical protein ABW195_13845 [Ilumatobacteraceae bacterium]
MERVDVVRWAGECRDVCLLRFAPDGRVADHEEWAYWPDRYHVASGN